MTAKDAEPRKVVVSTSLATAIKRCLPHVAPIATSTAVIWVNLRGIYIGIDLHHFLRSDTITLIGLQLLAKGNEILVVASLSLIVLHAVRHELLFGAGVPLGFIGSGLSFNDLKFFLSKEFFGGLFYLRHGGFQLRKLGLVLLLLFSGAIALLTGPASAFLLVPKAQDFAYSKTNFVLNGTTQQFWPDDLSQEVKDLGQRCTGTNSTLQDVCPGAGFNSLRQHWSGLNYTSFITNAKPSYAKELASSTFYWQVTSPKSQVPPLYTISKPRSDDAVANPCTWSVQAHAATATILQQVASMWWTKLKSHVATADLRIDDRNIRASVYSAISDVRCASPQNLSTSDQAVLFPTIDGWTAWSSLVNTKVEDLERTPANQLRFRWFRLPDNFGTSSIGAIFQSPWDARNSSRVVVGCSAQLGWVPTEIITDSYTFWSGWYPWGIRFGDRSPIWDAVATSASKPTNGRIAVPDEWLDLLTPEVRDLDSHSDARSTTTLELILRDAGLAKIAQPWNGTTLAEDWTNSDGTAQSGKTRLLEAIISSILVDGLSRVGSHRATDGQGAIAKWLPTEYDSVGSGQQIGLTESNDVTRLQASMHITGYAFRATLATYLSITVLLTHIFMATGHTMLSLLYRRSSGSWNSMSEYITLAQNSAPNPDVLANTSAGIKKLRTYARIGSVRIRPDGKTDTEHIELVFESEHSRTVQESATKPKEKSKPGVGLGQQQVENIRAVRKSWTFPFSVGVLRQRLWIRRTMTSDPVLSLLQCSDDGTEGSNDTVLVDRAYG